MVLSIEFAGSTGTGKTTLVRETRAVMESRGMPVFSPFELVFGRRARRLVPDERIQNVMLDVALFPLAIAFCARHPAVAWLLFSRLLLRPPPAVRAAARMRSLVAKMGVSMLRGVCRGRPGVVLVDEGMLHSVHHVFVYTATTASAGTLEAFARAVPLADLVVNLSASERAIVEATLRRSDPPIRAAGVEAIAESARRALELFDVLGRHPRIRSRSIPIRLEPDTMSLTAAATVITERAAVMLPEHAVLPTATVVR